MGDSIGEIVDRLFAGRRMRKQLRAAPRHALRDLPEGVLAHVTGRVRAAGGSLVTAPLTGRQGVYYQVLVESSDRHGWRVVRELQDGVSFLLDDDTATALIAPEVAQVSIAYDHEALVGDGALTPAQRELAPPELRGRMYRFREGVIAPDRRLVLYGWGERARDPDAAEYRDGAATQLRLVGTDEHPLVITDEAL